MNAVVRTTTVDLLIKKVRYLLKPGEVKLGNIPPWLVRRLRAYRKAQELGTLPCLDALTPVGSRRQQPEHMARPLGHVDGRPIGMLL
jgi:hypothetical protein